MITLSLPIRRWLVRNVTRRLTDSDRWVPSCGDPVTASLDSYKVIQLQCHNRGPSARRQSNNLNAVLAPPKFGPPILKPRIKELNHAPARGIGGGSLIGFESVTKAAG